MLEILPPITYCCLWMDVCCVLGRFLICALLYSVNRDPCALFQGQCTVSKIESP